MFFLDIPFEERALGSILKAEWYPGLGWAYVGKTLPAALQPYRPRPYSWQEWLERDHLNPDRAIAPPPAPDPTTGSFVLRRDQMEDVRTLLLARQAGAPEVLIGSEVGTGKTVVAISAIKRMAGVRNVLVVCPAGVQASWRLHLKEMGDGGKNWCIINYESTKKLLTTPSEAKAAVRTRTKNLRIASKGQPRVPWDVVITDESHRIANPESQQTRVCERLVAGLQHSAFAIRMSATAGSNPAELSYLHRLFAWRDGTPLKGGVTSEAYAQWCQRKGIAVDLSGFGGKLKWTGKEAELIKMNRLIYGGNPPAAIRRVPDWPDWVRIPVPVELTAEEQVAYEIEWAHFEKAREHAARVKAAGASTPAKARAVAQAKMQGAAAVVRYRQKAGQLRASGTASFVADMVSKGKQVAVSCEYLGTVEAIAAELNRMRIPVTTFTGQNPAEREDNRIAFQRGEYKVIVFTPAEGFSLHAGENMVGGNSIPRVTVVAEPRWSPKKALQVEGRAQRNATQAPIYYAFAVNTVEERVIKTVVEGMKNTAMINGADTAPFKGLAKALGVDVDLLMAS